MPFNPGALVATAVRERMFSRYDYETDDEIAEVLRPEYFRAAFFRFRLSDRIAVVAREDRKLVYRDLVVTELPKPDVCVVDRTAELEARVRELERIVTAPAAKKSAAA